MSGPGVVRACPRFEVRTRSGVLPAATLAEAERLGGVEIIYIRREACRAQSAASPPEPKEDFGGDGFEEDLTPPSGEDWAAIGHGT